MKVNLDLAKTNSSNIIADELLSNVGSSAFSLEHDRFFGSTDMRIWTGAGETGTQLTDGVDYSLQGLDSDLTAESVASIYSTVIILNATYQTGNLYFNYHAAGDEIDALDRYTIAPPLNTNFTVVTSGTGKVGFGTASPTLIFSMNEKVGFTSIGGLAVKLTNETGDTSVAGDVVCASKGTVDAVEWTGADDLCAIGVFLESGVIDGSEAWIVVSGIADVHMDAVGCGLGDRIIAGTAPRRGEASNLPAVAEHFQEIGHAIEIAVANANARCVIHFL